MKKVLKNRMFLVLVTAIIVGSIAVYATNEILASQVKYNNTPLDEVLDDLYSKTNKTPTQVATLTTRGASYTMENDGYILGSVHPSWQVEGSFIYFNGVGYDNEIIHTVNWSDNTTYNISIYAPKGVTVSTDSNNGTYNLTVYEWK